MSIQGEELLSTFEAIAKHIRATGTRYPGDAEDRWEIPGYTLLANAHRYLLKFDGGSVSVHYAWPPYVVYGEPAMLKRLPAIYKELCSASG
jgi:hypothetical protein